MNALWPLGEATVRQVQEALTPRRPRAYTTIMTILDRLAQKGIVARRKVGRAYVYEANLRNGDAQQHAVDQVIEGFFGGSRAALAEHLAGTQIAAKQMAPEQLVEKQVVAERKTSSPRPNEEAGGRTTGRESTKSVPLPARLDSTLL
jgi:predicted transcriptional regulator